MEYNDILKLNYQPFISHFFNQAKGELTPQKSPGGVVVVLNAKKPTKNQEKEKAKEKAAEEVKLVSPVKQSEDQAKEEIKREENPTKPSEITSVELFEKASLKRKQTKSNKKTPKKSKVVHDIFSN